MNLYSSRHFTLFDIRTSGKKSVRGLLCFKGLPSAFGAADSVVALEDGLVLDAGRCVHTDSRGRRLGIYVTVSGRDSVTVTYSRLASRCVKPGDYIFAGQQIGVEGDSGSGTGQYLALEIRRNGRLIDACAYLGIKPQIMEYLVPIESPADAVCRICDLSEETRKYIDSAPFSDSTWTKLLSNLAVK